MCSLGEDHFDNDEQKHMPEKEQLNLLERKCNKCRTNNPCVLLRIKDAYCKECFLAGTTHKFKSLLGKHRLIKPNDRVLISYQIGHPSTALLHFLRDGLDLNTPKKLRFEPVILFIQDQFNLSLTDRTNLVKTVKEEVSKFGFKLHLISLKEYILNENVINMITDEDCLNENNTSNIWEVIDKKANKTNRTDIISQFRRQLLLNAAKHLKCKFVFTSELSIDVASQLLTNISLGRGAHVPIDTGFCDDRDSDVKILRPLRLFDMKELVFYNYFNKLEPIFIKPTRENCYASVQELMKRFVTDLQVNYPATVTTILKTGDKLALDKNIAQAEMCQLCKGSITYGNSDLSSAESTQYSHWVSTQPPDYSITPQERYNTVLKSFEAETTDGNYCYSCTKISKYILNK